MKSNHFTKEQVQELSVQLAALSKKDTDFPVSGELTGEEKIAVVQDGDNVQTTLNQVSDFVKGNVAEVIPTEETVAGWGFAKTTDDNLEHYYTKDEVDDSLAAKQNTLVSGENIKTINSTSILGSGNIVIQGGDAKLVENVTWQRLKALRDEEKLVPGKKYRITDYVATTTQEGSRSAEHPFDIIVTALTANTLSEEASAAKHQGDGYFVACNTGAWKIWYCLDNASNRFTWADTEHGKGVIFRMIDEYGNDMPYDFKGIQFKRYKITSVTNSAMASLVGLPIGHPQGSGYSIDTTEYKWYYTLSKMGDTWEDDVTDAGSFNSYATDIVFDTMNMTDSNNNLPGLLDNVFAYGPIVHEFLCTEEGVTPSYHPLTYFVRCHFEGTDSRYNTIVGWAGLVTTRDTFRRNTIVGSFRHLEIGTNCQSNILFNYNDFSFCQLNEAFSNNSIYSKITCDTNFGSYFRDNTVSADCIYHSSFPNYVGRNTFNDIYFGSVRINGQLLDCTFSGKFMACNFSAICGYCDFKGGTNGNSVVNLDVVGGIRGTEQARVNVENTADFVYPDAQGTKRRICLEGDTNGNMVISWHSAGKLIRKTKGASGSTWTELPGEISNVTVSVDNNTGTPSATGTISNGTLSLSFSNLKGQTGAQGPQGPQGNTGSSVDYPYELVNNLTTDDATKGLSAAQGVVLEGEISQLGQEVNQLDAVLSPTESITTESASYFNQIGGIVYATGARGGSSNFTNYFFTNDNFQKVRAYVGSAKNTDLAAISFFDSTTQGVDSYIGGVAFENEQAQGWYEANVPENCVLIVISNRDTLFSSWSAQLITYTSAIAQKADDAYERTKSIIEKSSSTLFPINKAECNLYTSLTASGEYTSNYPMVSHPIRVVPGSTVNFAYTPIDVDGTNITPAVRVAFYSGKEMTTFVAMGNTIYGTPASLVVPAGANYMKVSISIGNYHCRNYYTDGAVTISFSEEYPYDFAQKFNDIDNELKATCLILTKADFRTGDFAADGSVVKITARSTTKEPYNIPNGVTSIVMKRPSNDIFLYGLVWLDENFSMIEKSVYDNYERIEVPSGAKYCYVTIDKDGAVYREDNIGSDTFCLNLDTEGAFSDCKNIIEQNSKIESLVKLRQIKMPAKVNGTRQTVPLSLLFFSDIHGDADNLKRLLQFHDYYNATLSTGVYIDAILAGGDSVQSYQALNAFDFWTNVAGSSQILNTVGNHDAMANAALTEFAAKKDVYDIEFAPFIANWGVTQPTDAAAQGLMYYYKDFTVQKIRLVVLDCMYWDAAQLAWFEGVLESAKTNNYAVIGVSHYPIGDTTTIDCNFLSKDYNPTGGARLVNPIAAVDSFISSGGEFICWLSGHTHADGFGTITDHAGQINLIIDTASSGGSGAQDADATIGARSQDCFNILGFDVYSKLIKVMRIGRDYDRHLRHIGEMCYDYANKQLLYTR